MNRLDIFRNAGLFYTAAFPILTVFLLIKPGIDPNWVFTLFLYILCLIFFRRLKLALFYWTIPVSILFLTELTYRIAYFGQNGIKEALYSLPAPPDLELGWWRYSNIGPSIYPRNFTTYLRGSKTHFNSNGFRDLETPKTKGPNTIRVLVFGGSITMGEGVSKSNRFTDQLEKILSLEFPNKKVEVVNFGLSGYGNEGIIDVFKKISKEYSADFMLISDIQFLIQKDRIRKSSEEYSSILAQFTDTKRDQFTYLEKLHSIFNRPDQLFFVSSSLRSRLHLNSIESTAIPPFVDLAQFKESLLYYFAKIRAESTDNISVVFIREPRYQKIKVTNQELAFEIAKKFNINIIDTNSNNYPKEIIQRVISANEWHPNAQLHQIYAESISQQLIKSIKLNR